MAASMVAPDRPRRSRLATRFHRPHALLSTGVATPDPVLAILAVPDRPRALAARTLAENRRTRCLGIIRAPDSPRRSRAPLLHALSPRLHTPFRKLFGNSCKTCTTLYSQLSRMSPSSCPASPAHPLYGSSPAQLGRRVHPLHVSVGPTVGDALHRGPGLGPIQKGWSLSGMGGCPGWTGFARSSSW